jgi:two-component sensor histidine kinase
VRNVRLDSYLQSLCHDLEGSLSSASHDRRIEFTAEPIEVPTDLAVPIGLVIVELVTIASRNTMPGGPASIIVQLERTESGIRFLVTDDGVSLILPASAQRGFGPIMIESLVRQLRGTLVQTPATRGSRVLVHVPLRSEDLPVDPRSGSPPPASTAPNGATAE